MDTTTRQGQAPTPFTIPVHLLVGLQGILNAIQHRPPPKTRRSPRRIAKVLRSSTTVTDRNEPPFAMWDQVLQGLANHRPAKTLPSDRMISCEGHGQANRQRAGKRKKSARACSNYLFDGIWIHSIQSYSFQHVDDLVRRPSSNRGIRLQSWLGDQSRRLDLLA